MRIARDHNQLRHVVAALPITEIAKYEADHRHTEEELRKAEIRAEMKRSILNAGNRGG